MRTLIALVASTAAVATPTVVAKIPVSAAAQPCAAQAGGRFVWVSEYGQPTVLRIDPRTNRVLGRSHVGFGPCALTYGAGSMWVEDTNSSTVSRLSATSGKRTAVIHVGLLPQDIAFADGSAWVTASGGSSLERIDPARNRVVRRWSFSGASGVVAAFGSIWVAGSNGVLRVDPATNRATTTVQTEAGAVWTAASDDAVWVTGIAGLVRIDPRTNTVVKTIRFGGTVLGDPDVVAGSVWVPEVRRNTVAIVDPATNAVMRTIKVGAGPFVLNQIAGEAWVPSWKGRDIWRIKP
jgi:YVTN family beta-propeller protein